MNTGLEATFAAPAALRGGLAPATAAFRSVSPSSKTPSMNSQPAGRFALRIPAVRTTTAGCPEFVSRRNRMISGSFAPMFTKAQLFALS